MTKNEYKWTIFAVTAIGNFISILDSSTVNIALYRISTDLNVNISQVQWVITAYMLVLTVLLPFFGKLGDIFPRNKLYAAGFLIFALGSFLNSTAVNLPSLIIYRCIEAVGASILISNSSAIISLIFQGTKRGKALGMVGSIIALGGMTGPAVGGILINFFGWQAIFIPSIPIALIGAYLSFKMIPSFRQLIDFKFDILGFIFFTVSMFTLLLGLSNGHSWGWTSHKVLVLAVLFISFGVLFLLQEKRCKFPIIDFDLFKNRAFSIGNLALLVSYLGLFTNAILFPFYAQEILNYSPLVTGLLILPFSIALIVTAPLSGNIAGKAGSRNLTVLGSIIMAIGLSMFATFNSSTNLIQIMLGQMLIGIGNGMFQSPSNTAIMNTAEIEHIGSASGILALFRNAGIITGVAIAINLFDISRQSYLHKNLLYETAFINAYHITLLAGVFFALLCSILSYKAYKNEKVKCHE